MQFGFRIGGDMLLFVVLGLVASVSGSDLNFDLKNELLDPAWQDVLSEGGLHVDSGRMRRFVTINNNQDDIPHEDCILPNGKVGQCRPLRYCLQEDFKTDFIMFLDYACVIKESILGACCPQDAKRGGVQGVAGVLPAIASGDEDDAARKAIKAENRGCGLSTRRQTNSGKSRNANLHEWPWMVSITPEYIKIHCGGSLITEKHVLTAAHCVENYNPDDLVVHLGEYDIKRNNDTRSHSFKVKSIVIHEFYESITHKNDIAIVKMKKPCLFNTYIWPICLPPPDLEIKDKVTTLIGWGTTFFGGPTSNVLQEVSIPVWEHEECVKAFVDPVSDENLCAGGRKGGKDACQYDSGGPLMYQMPSGRWTVVGVVSWGVRCGEPNHPGIYTRVDKYLPWIKQHTV